jgi:hypothetical protein
MRSIVTAAVMGWLLLPATVLAQTSPQTAAIETAAAPAATTGASAAADGITRQQYLERARERATQRAGVRFDQMDANHDGVLDRAERRAWRNQHSRHAAVEPAGPTPQ